MKNYLEKIMNSEPDLELERFVFRFLESKGAILEINDSGFEAILPEELADWFQTST